MIGTYKMTPKINARIFPGNNLLKAHVCYRQHIYLNQKIRHGI